MAGPIEIRRVYDSPRRTKGTRYLVERLWPRGVKKEDLEFDGWLREAAPSTQLRRWFGHDPARWFEFRRRYFAELEEKPEAWQPILEAARKGPVTLLYSSRETEYNNAAALKEYLESKLGARAGAGRA